MSLSTSIKTNLHERVVLVEVRLVQNVGFEVVVDQRLPSCWQTEDIEAINTGEVLPVVDSALAKCLRYCLGLHPSVAYICVLAISELGQLYCCSNSLGAKLPWVV